jgi:phage gp16-like protein
MTNEQLALIHVAKKQLGLDDDTYRAILQKLGRVESAKQLDAAGFEAVLRYFNSCGFESTWRKRNYGERPGMASPRQVALIRQLWREYTGGDDDAALNKWLERTCKLSALAFLTPKAAQDAITGLKKMTARGAGKSASDGAA